jgi:acetyl-CoA carboxylase biotin carboxyl carrier protein
MTSVKPEDIEVLVQVFDESDWAELRVALDGFEIFLSKDPADRGRGLGALPGSTRAPVAAPPRARAAFAPQTRQEIIIPDGLVTVRAPNLGTFYRSPKPGAPPYVSIGQTVTPDTEMCLIEVMKLFTSVRAGIAGTVREVCVDDAQLVEFDQPLFLIEPLTATDGA